MKRRDLIDILCDFDLIHRDMNVLGKIDFDAQIIYIKPQIRRDMRDTIIHELLHAYYYNLGIERTEEQIEKETSKLYNQIYKGEK